MRQSHPYRDNPLASDCCGVCGDVRAEHPASVTPFIVAEISKNWIDGRSPQVQLLAELFEFVIETNRQRGYQLHSFDVHRLMVGPMSMNETIIAVFQQFGVGVEHP